MMEALSSSEISVNIYQTTWYYIPKDKNLHTYTMGTSNLTYYHCLFIYTLFNDPFNDSDYTASNVRMTVNNELERVWKEVVIA
jgi:hypothetical protein